MKDNLNLKRGLITQSLSPVFVFLIIRHFHLDYPQLVGQFVSRLLSSPVEAVAKAVTHPRCGEFLIVVFGIVWIISSLISIPAFKATQVAGFESHGERVIVVEEQRDAAASFLMTFILPLLIDELSTLQYWLSYIFVIVVVYAVLYQSNLYYQSPVLALLGYKVFKFKVLNPEKGFEANREYIGISKNNMITEDAAIIWKHIADC